MSAPLLAFVALLAQADTVRPARPVLAVAQAAAVNVFVNRVDAWAFGHRDDVSGVDRGDVPLRQVVKVGEGW